jgi:hypothetical protein
MASPFERRAGVTSKRVPVKFAKPEPNENVEAIAAAHDAHRDPVHAADLCRTDGTSRSPNRSKMQSR